MTYNSNQDPLGNFIVIQDGILDEARIEQYERDIRITYLKQYTAEIGSKCVTGAFKVLRGVGSATMELFEAAAEAGREAA